MMEEILKLSDASNGNFDNDSHDDLLEILSDIHKLALILKSKNNRMVQQFIKAFEVAKRKNWDRIYIGVDIHETVLKPTWNKNLSNEYYEYAQEALQLMSDNKMICLILWSCSLPDLNKQYSDKFEKDGIIFDYINKNPECLSTEYADFDTKLYFSVGFDDKFGFLPEEDWKELVTYLKDLK